MIYIYISLSFNIQYTKPLQVQFCKPLKTHFKRIVKFEPRTFFENSFRNHESNPLISPSKKLFYFIIYENQVSLEYQ